MIQAAEELAQTTGMAAACRNLKVPRSSLYRLRRPDPVPADAEPTAQRQRSKPARALSDEEKAEVRSVLNSERFVDQSPREVYATLLDEEAYLCHWRTMYRVLHEHQEVGERRNQLQHPLYARPELLATGPNQLWSWDITRLRGPVTWSYYYLYVMLDVFSRYVVAWLLAERESAALAKELTAAACAKQKIEPGQLTIHADRGGPMTAKSMVLLMSDLGVNKSHSRPHVSDDNPYSEAQFRTLKYSPHYPDRFGSLMDARGWCEHFFLWYNQDHHHTSLHLLTPADVHYGRAQEKLAQRQLVLERAYSAHPERFVKGAPTMPKLATAVWINPPPITDTVANTGVEKAVDKEVDKVDGTLPPPTEPFVF
jgi:putative transposase